MVKNKNNKSNQFKLVYLIQTSITTSSQNISFYHISYCLQQSYLDYNCLVYNNLLELKSIRGGDVDKKQQKKSSLPETITLKTSEGDLRIKLRPDLSLESVQYIQKLLVDPNPCSRCRFYRAEKPGILQGILKKKNVNKNRALGKCPEGLSGKKHKCPEHDPNYSCHGPIMKRGMIAW
jgi:hypothetical protein